MCGIVGIFLKKGLAEQKVLKGAIQTLRHRGPDNVGSYIDGAFGMAHSRLSIIDLTGGNQPLYAQRDELALIANGEIYNYIELRDELSGKGHSFSTESDSEVILHAYAEYGPSFLNRLHGMFAFALYDRPRRRLLLARDRLGIKPLFIARLLHGIAFASELKAFAGFEGWRPEVNPSGLIQYLQNQFATGRTTVMKNVERILPGEAVWIENGTVVDRLRYWSPLDVVPFGDMSFREAEERFEPLLERVIQEHMRSDVPFGLFLSGGVDSSILMSLLARFSERPIRTFSVGFADTRLIDEIPRAEAIAKQFSSSHTSIQPGSKEIFHALPYSVWAADELMRDYASLPTALLAKTAAKELKVVFSGEGGDEVFAGYGRYRTSPVERWVKNLIAPGTGGFRTRGTFRGKWPRWLYGEELRRENESVREVNAAIWRETPKGWSDLQRMQYLDLVTALPDNLLVKCDRMLMGWGLEGRVPFLDHRIVEFGLALPDHLKVNGQGKLFLKKWATKLLPEKQLFEPKRGFHVPVGEWLQGDYLSRLKEVLPRHPAVCRWFEPKGVVYLLNHCGSSGITSRMAWALLQFAVWHQIFIEGEGNRPSEDQDPLDILDRI